MIIRRTQLLRSKPEYLIRLAKWLQIEVKDLTHQQITHLVSEKINEDQSFFDLF